MGKLLTVVLALAAMGGLAYYTMYGGLSGGTAPGQTPPERLKNAREAAKNIEATDQQHLEDVDRKSTGE